jgi:hypothetical protein
MTALEQRIHGQLVNLERTVAAMATTTPKPSILPLLAELSRLTGELPTGTDPRLLHYLHKHSFEKARLFLEGREAENAQGNCHGHEDGAGRPLKLGA